MNKTVRHHHHHQYHQISFVELGHLLTRSCLTYPEVSSKFYYDSFCQLGSSMPLPWVIYFEAFYLHVVSSFSCIPVICPKLVLFFKKLMVEQNIQKYTFFNQYTVLKKCSLYHEDTGFSWDSKRHTLIQNTWRNVFV